MYILAGMLVIGLICNLLIRPVADKWFMTDAELAEEKRLAHERSQTAGDAEWTATSGAAAATHPAKVALAWLGVGVPLSWGVWVTLQKAMILFR